nr:unnamed protein product [Callosobruchus analis]
MLKTEPIFRAIPNLLNYICGKILYSTKLINRYDIFLSQKSPEALKELGNNAVKEQKFEEAILYYSYAVKLDPGNYTLYSNSLLLFLKFSSIILPWRMLMRLLN